MDPSMLHVVAVVMYETLAGDVRLMFEMSAVCRAWRILLLPTAPHVVGTDAFVAAIATEVGYRKRITSMMLDHGWIAPLRRMRHEWPSRLAIGPPEYVLGTMRAELGRRALELIMLVAVHHPDSEVATDMARIAQRDPTRLTTWASSADYGGRCADGEYPDVAGIIGRSLRHLWHISLRRATVIAGSMIIRSPDPDGNGPDLPEETDCVPLATIGLVLQSVHRALVLGCMAVASSTPGKPKRIAMAYQRGTLHILIDRSYVYIDRYSGEFANYGSAEARSGSAKLIVFDVLAVETEMRIGRPIPPMMFRSSAATRQRPRRAAARGGLWEALGEVPPPRATRRAAVRRAAAEDR